MKKRLIIAILILLQAGVISAVTITDALQAKKITLSIKSTGSHYGKCVKMKLKNISPQAQEISITPGMYLKHENEAMQDHLITEEQLIALQPNQEKEVTINALCCQRSDGCPDIESNFTIMNYADEKANTMCKIISHYPQQAYAEQQALWCLLNKGNPNIDVDGEDSMKVMKYRNYICKVTSQKLEPFIRENYQRPVIVQTNTMEMSAKGNWILHNMKANDIVVTAIYDEIGKPVSPEKKEICYEPYGNIAKEKYNVKYEFTATDLNPNKKYFLRILVNGVVQKEYMYKAHWG
jgi:hypothetical protein